MRWPRQQVLCSCLLWQAQASDVSWPDSRSLFILAVSLPQHVMQTVWALHLHLQRLNLLHVNLLHLHLLRLNLLHLLRPNLLHLYLLLLHLLDLNLLHI